MKKILFELNQGWGNSCQMVPLYMNLKDKYDVDVCYYKEYETDSVKSVEWFPVDKHIMELVDTNVMEIEGRYDYTVRPPFVTKKVDGEHIYVDEVTLGFREKDTEVERYTKIGKYFNVGTAIRKGIRFHESPFEGDVVMHNGALNVGKWHYKRYPHMEKLVHRLKDMGLTVTSIGHASEYIEGTQNATGTNIMQTIGTIANHKHGIFTDTGSSQSAALLIGREDVNFKNGVIIYTCTDPKKNYDKRFHRGLNPVFTTLPCQPCQWNYHWGTDWAGCNNPKCRNIHPDVIMDMFDWMNTDEW